MDGKVQTPTSYDDVPYESLAYPKSHPDRLATLATLFGMTPAPVDRCRLLELGCAFGGNLIPMALELPESVFVGTDLSARQTEEARNLVKSLGISNIRLEHKSILEVDRDFGQFDYIIAHGVYSWVPDAVREKILAICQENLRPNGVAYVSYNTYPGWHLRGMIADMMCYHVRQFQEPRMRIAQARALLDFLAKSVPAEGNNAYGIMLKAELDMLRGQADWYLFHDHLEEVNDPVYFHQFIERAAAHGLQYLGEAEFSVMLTSGFPPQVAETLRKVAPDIIRMEQYLDFLRNRTFRQTLLCHRDQVLVRDLTPNVVPRFFVASSAQPVSTNPDIRSQAREQFRAPNGATLTTGNPIIKAAMMVLRKHWPQPLPYERLRAEAWAWLDPGMALRDAAIAALLRETPGVTALMRAPRQPGRLRHWRALPARAFQTFREPGPWIGAPPKVLRVAETRTPLKGDGPHARGVRTIVAVEGRAPTAGRPRKDRWHVLYVNDERTPPYRLIQEFRQRQHHEQGYRIGVHDLDLDAVPSGYAKASRSYRPAFRPAALTWAAWTKALAANLIERLGARLGGPWTHAHPRTLRRTFLNRPGTLRETPAALVVELDWFPQQAVLRPLVEALNAARVQIPGPGGRRRRLLMVLAEDTGTDDII